jgi:branched-chain amino acid aminotransferase
LYSEKFVHHQKLVEMAYDIKVTRTTESSLHKTDFSDIPFGKVISDHVFIADFDGQHWVNTRIEPYGPIVMAPSNLALHYGQSIFEGMKATICNGEPTLMRPQMHARRLNLSAERMCMPSVPENLFIQAVSMLIDVDRNWIPQGDDHALYLRPFMFATDEAFGVQASKTYRFMIFTGPVGPYYPKPIKLWVEEVFTRAAQGGAGEAKCAGNYGASLLPAMRAKQNGYDQVMWMDAIEKKYVQEVGTMNLFFVIDGKVVTPATTGTILRGITRDSFLTILKDHGYTVEDRLVSITEIFDAHWRGTLTEIFGAGTAAVVSHVSEITWRDNVIKLSEVTPETRPVSTFLKRYLNDLRTGVIEDRYGWLYGVDTNQAILQLTRSTTA